jgi:amino acid adenylation domain-containing protein
LRLNISDSSTFGDLAAQCRDSARDLIALAADQVALEIQASNLLNYPLGSPMLVITFQQAHIAVRICSSTHEAGEMLSQLAKGMEILADSSAHHSTASIWSPDLLSDDDREVILDRCRGRQVPFSEDSIAELFEKRAKLMPQDTALIYEDVHFSYQELNHLTIRLSNFLREIPVVPGTLVGTCLGNSVEAVVSMLAILKLGAAYVLLDPHQPPERLSSVIKDARLQVVITESTVSSSVSMEGVFVLDLDECSESIDKQPTYDLDNSMPKSGFETVAYVSYTSGSTGTPLGVLNVQGSILNGLNEALFDAKNKGEVCCISGSLNIGFQALGLFLPLLLGVTLVLLSETEYKDIILLARAIERYRVTTIVLPTTVLRQLLTLGQRIAESFRSIRIIQVGGSSVTAELVESATKLFPWIELRKAWGTTELGGLATKGIADAGPSIGRPVSNTRVYVLDQALRLVPVGAVGELCIAAPHLALGYVNQSDLTAARFVTDPFTNEMRLPMLRTGDLGRLTTVGEFEFLGRKDDQVKVRGYRVQPSEIENCLSRHTAVLESVVLAREYDGESRLIAWIVPKDAAKCTSITLRAYLLERLPSYMVPSSFVSLDYLPLTEGGKVDRRLLPDPEPDRPELPSKYAGPSNAEEQFLVAVWSELLGLSIVGIHDHFLELGGDSLFAVQLMSRMWDHYDLELPVLALYENPTIAELAVAIRQMQDSTSATDS